MLREKLRSHYSVKIYRAQMFKLIKALPYKFHSLILLFISPHKVLFALGTEWRQTKIFSYCRLIDRSGDSFFFFSLRLLFEEIIYYFSKQRWLNRFTVISLQFSINQGHYLYSLWQRFPVEWSVNLLLIFCFQQSALTELCVERVGRLWAAVDESKKLIRVKAQGWAKLSISEVSRRNVSDVSKIPEKSISKSFGLTGFSFAAAHIWPEH